MDRANPDICYIIITYLKGPDLLSYSRTNERFFYLTNSEFIWNRVFLPLASRDTMKYVLGNPPTVESLVTTRPQEMRMSCEGRKAFLRLLQLEDNFCTAKYSTSLVTSVDCAEVHYTYVSEYFFVIRFERELFVWNVFGTPRFIGTIDISSDLKGQIYFYGNRLVVIQDTKIEVYTENDGSFLVKSIQLSKMDGDELRSIKATCCSGRYFACCTDTNSKNKKILHLFDIVKGKLLHQTKLYDCNVKDEFVNLISPNNYSGGIIIHTKQSENQNTESILHTLYSYNLESFRCGYLLSFCGKADPALCFENKLLIRENFVPEHQLLLYVLPSVENPKHDRALDQNDVVREVKILGKVFGFVIDRMEEHNLYITDDSFTTLYLIKFDTSESYNFSLTRWNIVILTMLRNWNDARTELHDFKSGRRIKTIKGGGVIPISSQIKIFLITKQKNLFKYHILQFW